MAALAGAARERESREQFKQLVSLNTRYCGALSSRNCRRSVWAVLVGFLSGESCWRPLQSSLLESVMKSSVMRAVGFHNVCKGCCSTWQ